MEWTKEMCESFGKAVDEKVEEMLVRKKAEIETTAYRAGYRKGHQAGMSLGYRKAMIKILDYAEEKLDHDLRIVEERE